MAEVKVTLSVPVACLGLTELEKPVPFKELHSLCFWRYRLVVRTQDFHSCNRGSIPRSATNLDLLGPTKVFF